MHEGNSLITRVVLNAEKLGAIAAQYDMDLVMYGILQPVHREKEPYDVIRYDVLNRAGKEFSEKDTKTYADATLNKKVGRSEDHIHLTELGRGHSDRHRIYLISITSPNKKRLNQYLKGIEDILRA